jgi:two-component system OmpR family response regulator
MHGRRMLVVEDDQATGDLLRAIFTELGWVVGVASTVADALASLEPPPDFLLLDISLPDGDGAEILRRVRAANLPTRVAVTTGHDPASLGVVAALRPDAVLHKPIDVDEVCRTCGVR